MHFCLKPLIFLPQQLLLLFLQPRHLISVQPLALILETARVQGHLQNVVLRWTGVKNVVRIVLPCLDIWSFSWERGFTLLITNFISPPSHRNKTCLTLSFAFCSCLWSTATSCLRESLSCCKTRISDIRQALWWFTVWRVSSTVFTWSGKQTEFQY